MKNPLERAHLIAQAVDSHFHSLEMAARGLDPAAILEWCFAHGLAQAIDVSVSPEDLDRRRALTGRFDKVTYTAGFYPSESGRFASSTSEAARMINLLINKLDDTRVVAVGEIGMDAVHDYASLEAQQELFEAQLASASDRNLPVVVHNRECDLRVYQALRNAHVGRAGVMHCFSSDYATAKRFVDLGFLISFAGNLTFKNSLHLQDAARRLPGSAILVETDSPYLAPVPVRGKPNHPGHIGHTYEYLARLRGSDPSDLASEIAENLARLFGLHASDGQS